MAPRTTTTKTAADVSAPDADADGVDERPTEAKAAASSDDETSGTEYLNVTTGPVVYDKEGHQVDAGTWTPAVNLDAIGKTARSNDYLLPRSAL